MPHDKKGRLIEAGDYVRHEPYGVPPQIGRVSQVNPGSETCNLVVTLYQLFAAPSVTSATAKETELVMKSDGSAPEVVPDVGPRARDDRPGVGGFARLGALVLVAVLALLALALPARAAADARPPGVSIEARGPFPVLTIYTGTEAIITRGERREFVTARATVAAPLFAGLSGLARLDLAGSQDGGGLDYGDPDTFRRIEAAGGLGYDVGAVRFVGLGGVTFSVEGEQGAPQDARLYTMALLTRVPIGDDGYAYLGGGHHGPVGGWALLGALSVPAGPAYVVTDYAFPLSVTALQQRAWVLKVGAQVRVRRLELGGRP